jgi:hypothetical protein
MSYFSSIPQASDPRAESQGQILSNFQTINSVWAVNHAGLTGTSIQGRHDVLTIRPQTVDPTTSSSQVALYNKTVASIPELFFRPKSNGTPIQLTYPTLTTSLPGPPVTYPDMQQTFMAGPFVIYSGVVRQGAPTGIPSGTTVTVTPSSNLIYVSLTTSGARLGGVTQVPFYVIPNNISANTFQIYFIPGSLIIPLVYYFAVGV